MTGAIVSTWATRDLPVLRAIAMHFDQNPDGILHLGQIDVHGVEPADVERAIRALTPRYVEANLMKANGNVVVRIDVRGITEEARRAVGLWPSSESVDGLVEALEKAADQTDDRESKGKLRKAAEYIAGAPRDLMVDVLGATISRGMFGP